MRQHILIAAAFASTALIATPAAASVSLTFEGVNTTYPANNNTQILDFYNGGLSSVGTSGTNYGISFGSNALAICLNSTSVTCSNTSKGGLGDPSSAQTGLFFTSGGATYLNSAAGFDTGFSFNYSSVGSSGSVNVYDGLNGTGNILATLNLSPNASSCPGFNAGFCPFGPSGVLFSGTAHSIAFGGVANQIVFDDITFGSDTPGNSGVPEPSAWAMMLIGFGGVGGAIRRKRRNGVLALA